MRVSQLDTHLLDDELLGLLTLNLDSALSLFPRVSDNWNGYLRAAVRAVIWKVGIWDRGESYGSAMQSLQYVGLTRSKKLVLGLVAVVGPLLQERLGQGVRGRARLVSSYLEAAYEVLTLANFIAYIAGGRYDTLLHRLLHIRLRPATAAYRAVSFEFLNRQLVWSQFTEFLLVFLPLLNLPRLRRRVQSYLPKPESELLGFLPTKTCAVCYSESREPADVVSPYEADCGHIYCYGCLVSNLKLAEGEGWDCLRCGKRIVNAKPWRRHIDEEEDGQTDLAEFRADEDELWQAEDEEASGQVPGRETPTGSRDAGRSNVYEEKDSDEISDVSSTSLAYSDEEERRDTDLEDDDDEDESQVDEEEKEDG